MVAHLSMDKSSNNPLRVNITEPAYQCIADIINSLIHIILKYNRIREFILIEG